MGMCIVIYGNPVDGFQYVGPFKTPDDAQWWADRVAVGADWWLAELQHQSVMEGFETTPSRG